MPLSREEERRRLLEKARLLWRLVTTTAGVGDLAEPLRRVERNFAHLSKGQRTTVAMIAMEFEKGCHEINEEAKPENKPEIVAAEVIQPDEIIPPGAPKD